MHGAGLVSAVLTFLYARLSCQSVDNAAISSYAQRGVRPPRLKSEKRSLPAEVKLGLFLLPGLSPNCRRFKFP
jgi:hypothetical protein